jgi:hypothetical protein
LPINAQIFTEHFNYTSTGNLANDSLHVISIPSGGTQPNWVKSTIGTDFNTFPLLQDTGSLSYGTYPSIGGGVKTTNTGMDCYRSIAGVFNGTCYLSAIIRIDSAYLLNNPTTTRNYLLAMAETNAAGGGNSSTPFTPTVSLFVRQASGNSFQVGVAKANYEANAVYGTTYPYGTVIYVVLKIEFLNGTTDDKVSMFEYSNNNMPPSTEPSFTSTTFINSPSFPDPFKVTRVVINQQNFRTPKSKIDFIRLGTSWNSVTDVPPPLGLSDPSNKQNAIVYPNPASHFITIKKQDNVLTTVKIINALGQTVKTTLLNTTNTIDISELANGLYFLETTARNKTEISKFTKSK